MKNVSMTKTVVINYYSSALCGCIFFSDRFGEINSKLLQPTCLLNPMHFRANLAPCSELQNSSLLLLQRTLNKGARLALRCIGFDE